MIWHPKPGERVILWYAEDHPAHKHHGKRGRVFCVAEGRRMVNALVELDEGETVVVPRGNLRREDGDGQ